jgi:hypothetical protein
LTAEVEGPAPAGPPDHTPRLSTQPYPEHAQTPCPYMSSNQNDHYQFPLAAGQVACGNNAGSRLEAGPPPVLLPLCSHMSYGGDEKPVHTVHNRSYPPAAPAADAAAAGDADAAVAAAVGGGEEVV